MNEQWGPLDDFDDVDDDEPSGVLVELASRDRRYARLHEYVSDACTHRQHRRCLHARCQYCQAMCQCVCHSYPLAVESA